MAIESKHGFEFVSSELAELTPEVAEKHRDMKPSMIERDFDPKRAKYLGEKINDGLFIPPSWAIVELNGEDQRMNGQHSSAALCEAEVFPAGLKAHIDRYRVEDEHGLVMLFRQFDARCSGRTATDVSGAYMKRCPNLRNVPAKLGLDCARAICFYKRFVLGLPTPAGDDVGKIFEDESTHDFILWMATIEWRKAKEVSHPAVRAAMYASFDHSADRAREFWDSVIYRRQFFEETHPATALEDFLMRILKQEKPFEVSKPKPGELYASSVVAWNAFQAAKSVDFRALYRVDPKKGFPEIAA